MTFQKNGQYSITFNSLKEVVYVRVVRNALRLPLFYFSSQNNVDCFDCKVYMVTENIARYLKYKVVTLLSAIIAFQISESIIKNIREKYMCNFLTNFVQKELLKVVLRRGILERTCEV